MDTGFREKKGGGGRLCDIFKNNGLWHEFFIKKKS